MNEQQVTTPAVDGDAARYAEMAKDYGDNAAPAAVEPVAERAAEPVIEAKPEEKKPEPVPYEELDKRYRNLQGALGEARGESRTLKQQMEQLAAEHKRTQDFLRQISEANTRQNDPNADPYLDPVKRQVDSLAEQQRQIADAQRQQQEAWAAQQQQQQVLRAVEQSERAFAQTTPDYYDAVKELRGNRMAEYEYMYPDDNPRVIEFAQSRGHRSPAELREALLQNDVMEISAHAMQIGVPPAQLAYEIAQKRGYRKAAAALAAAPAARPAIAQPSPITTIRQGQAAAASLSTGAQGGSDGGYPSQAELAQMYLDDPERAEGIIGKMRRAGVLF